MNKLWILLIVVVTCATETWAVTSSNPVVRMSVTLADGSLLKGAPKFSSLSVDSTFGPLSIALDRLTSATLQHSNTEVLTVLTMRNGDRVSGRLAMTELGLETCFGLVRLPVALTKTLQFTRSQAGTADVPTDGIILHYSFDGGEGEHFFDDQSGAGHHGRGDNAIRSPDGKTGGALKCDGAESFVVCSDRLPETMPAITLAAWIQPDVDHDGPILEFSQDNNHRGPHLWLLPQGTVYVNFWGAPDHTLTSATRLVQPGKWSHVACTYDGQRGVLYVNGIPAANQSWEKLILKTGYPFQVGTRHGWPAGDHTFKGLIDEVLVYDRALTADEIKELADR